MTKRPRPPRRAGGRWEDGWRRRYGRNGKPRGGGWKVGDTETNGGLDRDTVLVRFVVEVGRRFWDPIFKVWFLDVRFGPWYRCLAPFAD